MAEKNNVLSLVRIVAVLTLICTLVALLLSGVYAMTNEVYEQNILRVKQAAIAALFDLETVETEALDLTLDMEIEEAYRVTDSGVLLGYCANVKSAGFGGDIDMMVAIDPNGTVLGVKIVSMSETPGLGSRVGTAAHLSQYEGIGASDAPVLGEDVDAVSGATVSSRAVNAGVNRALRALLFYQTLGEEMP